ncbi:hypothetical protein D3C72_1003140 [compost metagenome]
MARQRVRRAGTPAFGRIGEVHVAQVLPREGIRAVLRIAALLHHLLHADGVVAGLGGEHAGTGQLAGSVQVGAPGGQRGGHHAVVAADGVVAGGGGEPRSLVEQRHLVAKPVAVDAGNGQQHVHAGPAQFGIGNQPHVLHAAARVPYRRHAHQPERLGLHRALMPFRFAVPEHHRHRLRQPPRFLPIARQRLRRHGLAKRPRRRRGDLRAIEGMEVAARGQAVGRAHRVAKRPGRQIAARQHGDEAVQFGPGRCAQIGQPLPGELERGPHCRRLIVRQPDQRRRAAGHQILGPRAHLGVIGGVAELGREQQRQRVHLIGLGRHLAERVDAQRHRLGLHLVQEGVQDRLDLRPRCVGVETQLLVELQRAHLGDGLLPVLRR